MSNGSNWTKSKKNEYQKAWYKANKLKTNIKKQAAQAIAQASAQSQPAVDNQAPPPNTSGDKIFYSAYEANNFWGVGKAGSDWQGWKDGLTGREKGGITRYTGSAYIKMNDVLRNGATADADTQKSIDGCRTAIAKATLSENIVVWRGTSSKIFGGNKTIGELQKMATNGEILVDKGFGSAAISQEKAWGHKGYILEVHVPAGQGRGQWVAPISSCTSEDEYMLHDHAIYRMIGARTEKGKKIVSVELLN